MNLCFENVYVDYKKYIQMNLKPQSINPIIGRIENHILPYFKNYNIYDIKEIDVLNWHYELQKKDYSFKYLKILHTCLVTFLNFCMKYYDLEKNVASRVGNFRYNGQRIKKIDFYTLEEFNLFIENVENEIYKQFFYLMFYTGVRPGEAMALKFSDLTDSVICINKTISERKCYGSNNRVINSPKTLSSIRKIIIDKKTNEDLLYLKKYYEEKYKKNNFDYYIFGGIKPLAPTTINRYKFKACEKCNLKNIRLHDFRHSHATLLLDNNISITEISKRLGHNNVSTTLNIYVHNNFENEKRVYDTLNSLR